jgi:hypothetical protein
MTARLVQLVADDLEYAPVVGSGCCGAVAPDDLARDELNSWPGVQVQSLNIETGIITIALEDNAPSIEDLLDALKDQGISAHLGQDPGHEGA